MTIRFDEHKGLHVGDKHISWAKTQSGESVIARRFFIQRRARIPFENGLELSVIWCSGSYSSNYNHILDQGEFIEEPVTVEVMVMSNDAFIYPEEDSNERCNWPAVYVTEDELQRLILETMRLPSNLAFLPEGFFNRDN